MYRFLLRPRWIALVIVVALLVAVFVQLGRWQLHRLDDRRAANAVIERNGSAAAKPLDAVLARGEPVADGEEWTRVSVRGRYDGAHQILVRYRSQGGEPGFNVLSPLVMSNDTGVLVNRGWVPRTASVRAPEPPSVPAGEVSVLGRVRPSETADPGTGAPRAGQVRFIDVEQIAAHLPYPVVGGYLELIEPAGSGETSKAAPRVLPPPELSEGPHLAYAVQWFLFALIAVLGVGFLAYDEAHDGRLRRRLRTAEDGPRPVPVGGRGGPD